MATTRDLRDRFWEEKVALVEAGDVLVTERHGRTITSRVLRCVRSGEVWHYVAHPPVLDPTVPAHLGSYGDTYAFRLLGSGEVVVSNDVWTQGAVPEAYLALLPVNATELRCTCRRNRRVGDARVPRWPVEAEACERCEAVAALTEEVRHG